MVKINKKEEKIHNIFREMERINDIDSLIAIEEFVRDCQPIDLHTYINIHFDEYHEQVRQAFEHEVRSIYLDIKDMLEPSCDYVNHFCELYVQGHELDIWIHENGSLFNPCELAVVIFKLWTNEIVPR